MAKKAVTAQERLEKLIAGCKANADGPKLDMTVLKGYVDELNELQAKVGQAKQMQKAATKARDVRLKEVLGEVTKSPKVKDFVLSTPKKTAKKSSGK